jgi:hypothetical protein
MVDIQTIFVAIALLSTIFFRFGIKEDETK